VEGHPRRAWRLAGSRQRAARAFASSVSTEPEEIEAVKREDVEALVALSIHVQWVALRKALAVLLEGSSDHAVTRAAYAAARLQTAITASFVRLGFVRAPEREEVLRDLRALGMRTGKAVLD
jgi:hypothetical protein